MLQLLIGYGANIHIPDKQGNTPLSIAVMRYRGDDRVIKLLLDNGADPHTPNHYGITLFKFLTMPKNIELAPLFNQRSTPS